MAFAFLFTRQGSIERPKQQLEGAASHLINQNDWRRTRSRGLSLADYESNGSNYLCL